MDGKIECEMLMIGFRDDFFIVVTFEEVGDRVVKRLRWGITNGFDLEGFILLSFAIITVSNYWSS